MRLQEAISPKKSRPGLDIRSFKDKIKGRMNIDFNTRRLALLFLILLITGCSVSQKPRLMEVSRIGFSIELPVGWRQGTIPTNLSSKYIPKKEGKFCFESANETYPFGWVGISLGSIKLSLEGYVKSPILSKHGVPVSITPRTIDGFESLEVVGEALYKKKTPVKCLAVYIKRDNRVISFVFWSLKENFRNYEPLFRNSIESIRIKNIK